MVMSKPVAFLRGDHHLRFVLRLGAVSLTENGYVA
jgi:hypothetical protein